MSPGARLAVVGVNALNTSFAANISGSTGTGLIVTNSGNVGIGTTDPSYELEIVGDIYNTGNATSTLAVHGAEFCVGNDCISSWPSGTSPWTDNGTWINTTNGEGLVITASSTITANLRIDGSATTTESFYVGSNRVYGEDDKDLALATSTLDYLTANTATSTIPISFSPKSKTISEIYCITDVGAATIRIGDGTNFSQYITCTTSGTTESSPTSNTYTAYEKMEIETGNRSTLGDWLNVNVTYNYD